MYRCDPVFPFSFSSETNDFIGRKAHEILIVDLAKNFAITTPNIKTRESLVRTTHASLRSFHHFDKRDSGISGMALPALS